MILFVIYLWTGSERVILAAEELNLNLFSDEDFPDVSLIVVHPSPISFPKCWLRVLLEPLDNIKNVAELNADLRLSSLLCHSLSNRAGTHVRVTGTDGSCVKVINTTKEIRHCWSNPYLHFIFRVSPGKMTIWSFAMLSVGFSKNSSSARPGPNKEEIIIRRAIQHGQNRHNTVEASFLFCK